MSQNTCMHKPKPPDTQVMPPLAPAPPPKLEPKLASRERQRKCCMHSDGAVGTPPSPQSPNTMLSMLSFLCTAQNGVQDQEWGLEIHQGY